MALPQIDRQTALVDPHTGRPTEAFMQWLDEVTRLGLFDLVDVFVGTPADGAVLTYSAANKKWVAA